VPDGALQLRAEGAAIVQAGQRVVVGVIRQFAVQPGSGSDIAERDHRAKRPLVGRVHGRDRAIDQDHVAIAANQRDDRIRVAGKAFGQDIDAAALVVGELHHLAQPPAQARILLPARQVRCHRVEAGHPAPRIDDGDAVRDGAQGAVVPLVRFLASAQLLARVGQLGLQARQHLRCLAVAPTGGWRSRWPGAGHRREDDLRRAKFR
jgi:hypothetical protein